MVTNKPFKEGSPEKETVRDLAYSGSLKPVDFLRNEFLDETVM